MFMGKGRWLIVGAVIGAVACSDDDERGAKPPGSVELGGVCNRVQDCKPVADQELNCQCAGGTSETTCVTLLDLGARCGNGPLACRSGAACLLRDGGGEPKCEAVAALGASCTDATCAPGTRCDGSVCVQGWAVGQSCDYFDLETCQPGAHCTRGGVCEADAPDGAPCSGDECGPSGECVNYTGRAVICVRAKKEGESCQGVGGFGCEDGLDCKDDRCVPRTQPVGCGF